MTRLIDADAFKRFIAALCILEDIPEHRAVFSANSIYELLDKQQTAKPCPYGRKEEHDD